MDPYKVDFKALPWETLMAGLRSKSYRAAGRQLRLAEYSREMEPHWCEKGHIGCILEGRFEIRFEGGVVTYNPGDGVFIPSGKEHRHMGRAVTEVVRIVFVEDV